MTQEELWSAYCARNPSFASKSEVTLTTSGLKKLFEQTWKFAYEAGQASEKEHSSRLTDDNKNVAWEQLFRSFKK